MGEQLVGNRCRTRHGPGTGTPRRRIPDRAPPGFVLCGLALGACPAFGDPDFLDAGDPGLRPEVAGKGECESDR